MEVAVGPPPARASIVKPKSKAKMHSKTAIPGNMVNLFFKAHSLNRENKK
jgi:hypothetical protein